VKNQQEGNGGVASRGQLTIDRITFSWEVQQDRCNLFPGAEKMLLVRSQCGASEFLIGVQEMFSGTPDELTWMGPAFIRAAAAPAFPAVTVEAYYLFPAFKRAKAGGIHGENVRSIVASLLNGRRLRRVNSRGMPLAGV
jgi:hypothetical protein